MKTQTKNNLRRLRDLLGQTQTEFAQTIGVSKDAVASCDCGRNAVSAGMARRVALATGVDERALLTPGAALVTLDRPRRPYTREEYERYRKEFWGGSTTGNIQRQLRRCEDALGLLFTAAVQQGRLPGVLGAFIQWCHATRADFDLGKAVDAQLNERKRRVELNHSYKQWRQMAKEQPKLARQFGFKDDPRKADSDVIQLGMETVPVWMPGHSMRGEGGKG
jgi:transcriptional regulator with XRE-family HTH domain